MNTHKVFTEDIRTALVKSIAEKAVTDLLARAKDAGDQDSGSFKVVASTDDRDRQGERVMQDGWDLSFYKLNSVVLWAHDYQQLPIGVCTSISVVNGQLVAEGKFAPADANPMAQMVRRLYDLGMMKTVSVGFIARERDQTDWTNITKAELLEFSFVPVPANPYALSMRQITDLKIDRELLATKGLKIEVKEEAPAPAAPAAEAPAAAPAAEAPKDAPAAPAPVEAPAVAAPVEQPAAPAAEKSKKEEGEDVGDNPTADAVRMIHCMKEIHGLASQICTALKDFVESEGGKSAASNGDVAPTNRSKSSQENQLTSEEVQRDLVKAINIATGKILRGFNRAESRQ